MSEQDDKFRPRLWTALADDNGGMLVIAVGVASGVLTFLLGGPAWTLVLLGLLLVLGVVALVRTLLREHAARVAAEARIATTSGTTQSVESTSDRITSEQSLVEAAKPSALEAPAKSDQPELSAERVQTETAIEPVDSVAMEKAEAKPKRDPISEAYAAAFDRRIEDVDALLSDWVSDAPAAERADRQSLIAYLHVIAGRHADVNTLREIADRNPKNPVLIQRLALALEWMGEKRQAANEIAQRLAVTSRKLLLQLQEARLRRGLGEPAEALALAREVLRDNNLQAAVRRDALAEQGRDLEAMGQIMEAFGSFEQALEVDPANMDVRFHLAYQYSQHNLKVLALVHYEVLESQNATGMAINNLGAALHDLGLPMLGTAHYITAAKEGIAISHGNLAGLLLDGGFLDEAKHWIAEGEKVDQTNRRVVDESARIQRDREAERTRYEELLSDGSRLREATKSFALSEPSELPVGRFLLHDGTELEFGVDGDVSKAKSEDGWEFEARVSGRLLEVKGKKGLLGFDRAEGWLSNRNGDLRGFLRDWPQKGTIGVFLGSSEAQ